MIYQIIISFAIYAISFCLIENTIYRMDSNNIQQLTIIKPLIEGIIGPFRTLYYLLRYDNMKTFINYLLFQFTHLNNIFGSTFFTLYVWHLIQTYIESNKKS